jgi:hypothetical protein
MTPLNELASTTYCLANPAREFFVYLPEGDGVSVDLSGVQGTVITEWMHPFDGTITPGGSARGGAKVSFAVPFEGPAVLHITKEGT